MFCSVLIKYLFIDRHSGIKLSVGWIFDSLGGEYQEICTGFASKLSTSLLT